MGACARACPAAAAPAVAVSTPQAQLPAHLRLRAHLVEDVQEGGIEHALKQRQEQRAAAPRELRCHVGAVLEVRVQPRLLQRLSDKLRHLHGGGRGQATRREEGGGVGWEWVCVCVRGRGARAISH